MSAIDDILWLLKDGKWHNVEDITQSVALPKSKAETVISFLGEYNFIQLNENVKKIKIQPSMLEFIEGIQRLEETGT
jgi:DNA-binding IclR family transcriptional regulator